MHNWPNITTAEVAVVCTAALLLCILPNFVALADVRRRRRQVRAAAEQVAMQRRASEAALEVTPEELLVPAPIETVGASVIVAAEEPLDAAVEPAVAIAAEGPHVAAEPPAEAIVELGEPIAAPAPPPVVTVASAERVAPAPTFAAPSAPASDETTPYTLRLDELRRVKLPNWPPAEVRDDPDRKRVWEEALRAADQPLITAMQLKSPRLAESACLASGESIGSVLRLRFLLFPELWPVAAEQATAEAVLELDSASGDVRGSVRSL